jgi:hypothetical protein
MTAKNREAKEAAMTAVNITNTNAATPPAEADIVVAVAETLATIDELIVQTVALSQDAARLKQELAELGEERRVREAVLLLSIEGRNEAERQARLRLELSSDADYRTLLQAEKDARLKLAEVEGKRWASRQKVAVCLALLRLAAGQAVEAEEEAP